MGDEYEEVEYTTDGRQSGLKGMLAALVQSQHRSLEWRSLGSLR